MATVAELNVSISADTSGLQQGLSKADSSISQTLSRMGATLQKVGIAMTAAITAPLVLLGKQALDAGRSFETAFAGVRKTVDATEPELAKLSDEFRKLAKEIPITANEMARIGEAAGALGVKKEDILAFTRTMADLGVATNLTSDQAATGLARLANIISNEAGPQFDRLGATLVALGNAGASTESEILDMSLRIASAGKIAGLSEPEILGFANALSSLGLEAEAGGTSFSRLLTKLTDATKLGGKELQIFAQVAGQSAAEFKKAFETDAAGATIKFIEGLGKIAKSGQSLTPVLKELELADIRLSDALRRTAGSGDLLRNSVELGTKAWAENTALTKEASERYKTFDSQLQIFKNRLTDVGITLFNELRPALDSIINALKSLADWLGSLDPTTRKVVVVMGLLAASVGPVLLIFGSLARAIVSLSEVMTLLHVTAIPRLITGLGGLGAAAGLAGVAVAGAFVAAEFQFQRMKNRFIEGQRQIQESAQQTSRAAVAEAVKAAEAMKKAGFGTIKPGEKITLSVGITADTAQAEKTVTAGMGRIKDTATGGGKAAGKAFRDPFLEEVRGAMKDVLQAIEDGLLGGDKIGRVLAEKISPIVDSLKQKAAELATTVRAAGDALSKELGSAIDTITPKIVAGDASFEMLINRMIAAKKASEETARAMKEEFDALSDQFRQLSSSLPRSWNTIIDAILTGSGRLGSDLLKLGVKIKGVASDVLNVFDDMPGKWGDAFRRTIGEINQWVNFIDSAIRLIERVLGSESPSGLGGILSKVGEVFKQTTADVSQGAEDIAKGVGSASNSIGQFATQIQQDTSAVASSALKMLSSVGLAIGGLVSLFTGQSAGGLVGGIQGALSGAAAGFGLGSLIHGIFGTFLTSVLPGLGAAVFGVIGLIKGLFGGKSAAQKQQEKLQLEQLKISVQQSAQAVVSAAIEGFDRALAFFEHLDEFTAPRKRKFAQFWTAMTRLMNGFLELAKLWSTESLNKAKEAADAIRPIAEAISALPDAFSAISGHFGLAQSSIDRFFADFDKVMEAFFARADVWIDGVSKRAKKVAQRLLPAVELIANFGTALSNIADIKEPSDEVFEIFDRVIDKILTHVVNLNLRFEKDVLKAMANFSERAGSALALWSEAVSSFKEMVDIKLPTEQDFANVFSGIEQVIKGMTSLADRLDTTALEKAQAIANASLAIFASVKAGVDALSSLRDFTGVLPEVFTAFQDGFNRAVDMLIDMSKRAMQFDQVAHTFESYIASGSASLAHAFTMLAQIMSAAGSFFPGGSPIVVPEATVAATSVAPASMVPTSMAPTSATSSGISLTLNLSPGDPRTPQIIAFIEQIFGAGTLSSTSSQFA